MNTQVAVPAAHQPSLFSWPLLTVCGIAFLLFVPAALSVVDRTMILVVWCFAVFALAPNAGDAVYSWILIGFSAAFAAAMFDRSWSLRLPQRRRDDTVGHPASPVRP
ncbi:hypothetical protein [Acidithiobacillus sp.]